MKIALQFAMPSEFHAMPGAKDMEPFETVSGVPFYRVEPDIIACAGGVSKVNAAMAAEILCLKYGVDLILNAGVAGCLTDLPTGSLVVASEFVQHDVDTTAVPHMGAGAVREAAGGHGDSRRYGSGGHRRLVCREL